MGFINVAVCLSLQSSTTSLVVFSIRLRYVFQAHPLLFCLRKLGGAAAAQELVNLGHQKISQKREMGTRGRREIFFFFFAKKRRPFVPLWRLLACVCVCVCAPGCVHTFWHVGSCWSCSSHRLTVGATPTEAFKPAVGSPSRTLLFPSRGICRVTLLNFV